LFFGVGQTLKPAALRLEAGGSVPASIGGQRRALVSLSDGSAVDAAPGARLELLESTGSAFVLALRSGTAEFEVHPGGPRTWRIECAGVVIEVVGTHFTVSRTPASLRVSVERGSVLVRGNAVPDQVVRLGAGQSIVVPLTDAAGAPSGKPAPTRAPENAPAEPSSPDVRHGVDKVAPTNPNLEPGKRPTSPEEQSTPNGMGAAGTNRVAFGAFDAGAPRDTVEAALHDADALRKAGQFQKAAALLESLAVAHANDVRAPLVEFSLGRLYLESLGDGARAATHFSRALELHLPAALAEGAAARLVEAYARAGNRSAAENAAAAYRAAYPNGRRTEDVARWAN
jgi:transmembrane sensor